jgi:hypothetical protein
MSRKLPVLLFLLFSIIVKAQEIRLRGNVADTGQGGLPNALLMAIRFKDSTLINSTRSNSQGIFKPIKIPLDTYLVIISHPAFSDKTYLLAPSPKDTAFHFKNVILPPKSIELNEVEVIAHQEKSYYKGDTLVFTADSFKTRPNATVEDLLKKLPGVRVDAKGKITIQGKEVDQVLVDGDEFFGSDPTVATRNLNAASIENVQVYDKKNENTAEGQNETLKVVNLKMKEDAKKGYFGKVSGASDFQKFYENELLANKFKGSRKISLFGIVANTPKQAFDWNETNKYGLSGEQPYSYNDETGSWTNNNERSAGIPQTVKSGVYFNDKYGKKTKVNGDYTFNQNEMQSGNETNTQFFLEDTTYSNFKRANNHSRNQIHNFNFKLSQKLDSLTELVVAPKIKYSTSESNNFQADQFISEEGDLTRETIISNKTKNESMDANVLIRVNRNFLKKDRAVMLSYQPVYNSGNGSTLLGTDFFYYRGQLPDSSLNQKKTQSNSKMEHNALITYVEPFTKKFKAELNYNFVHNQGSNNKQTFDFSGAAYDNFNQGLSNNFNTTRIINRGGLKLIYEVKKYKLSLGSNFRNTMQENRNVTRGQRFSQSVNNILPMASFNYRISQGSNFSVFYNSSSQLPDLMQLQPVVDNSDPNRISIGNPNLKPTFNSNLNMNYYFYKGVSDVNFYGGLNGSQMNNQISSTIFYDSLGRAVTQPININGNYNSNMYLGGGFPIFNRFMKIYYNLNANISNNVSYVNGVKNLSRSAGIDPGLTFAKTSDAIDIELGGSYSYTMPKSTISAQSNQPYYTYELKGSTTIRLPKKFSIWAEGNYTDNGNRTPGYNLNFFIVNASLSKTFLKSESLIVSLNANDILNQNISNQRYINSNQIVDTKTQIIRRYFLLKVTLKFNSQKTSDDNDD